MTSVMGLPDLDPDAVRKAIAAGESLTVEFKGEQRQSFNDRDLVEAVVCLANGRGGYPLIGVEDDGTVTGARPRHEAGMTDPLRVQALIANSTQPPVRTTVDVVDVDGRPIVCVQVEDSPRIVGTARGMQQLSVWSSTALRCVL